MAEGLGGGGGDSIMGRKQQLLVDQPETKTLQLHNAAVQNYTQKQHLDSVLAAAPAVLI